jgi:ABC-type nitrate/sulfonate/bicarbonate transport system substrate-binding protein
VAIAQGYRRLGLSTEAVAAFQFQVVAARRAWAQANKDAAVRFVRALGSAFRFIRDDANRDEVVQAIVALTGASDDIARATLSLYFEPDKGVMPKQAEIDIKGLAQVIAFMEGAAARAGALRRPAVSACGGSAIGRCAALPCRTADDTPSGQYFSMPLISTTRLQRAASRTI